MENSLTPASFLISFSADMDVMYFSFIAVNIGSVHVGSTFFREAQHHAST